MKALDVRTLTIPLLHLRGEDDPYVLADPVDRTRRYAPHGKYVTLPGVGHFAHEESPDEVNAELTRFLGELAGPPV
jgi:pimeloyl-ACP methyl ester carboxylesterase